jgi:maltooligosyltrehalose trehalohydrolase
VKTLRPESGTALPEAAGRPETHRPVGARLLPRGGVEFRVWCPKRRRLSVVVERGAKSLEVPLDREPGGYFATVVEDVAAGDRYRFRVGRELLADPASRFQPDGVLGPSEIMEPTAFVWTDTTWKGRPLRGAVLYEMHCGTFTSEGSWRAAAERLPHLADLGVTVIELMPVAEFAGRFGWGYDGVFPFAPTRLYGRPDDFKAFVNRAHELGLAIVLDVVYNHLGPSGCVFQRYSKDYFSKKYATEWGEPINFDGPGSEAVRAFFLDNAAYWIEEFHLDGLRIDATQCIFDSTEPHILAEITRTVRRHAPGRATLLVSENEPQKTRMVRPLSEGGYGLDALWNDDFHHSAVVALTGRCEAYFSDHHGTPQEFISAAKYGFLFQGQRYAWQKQPRGTPTTGIGPESFILFIENHDQLANTGDGERLHRKTSSGRLRAMTAMFLLLPGTPLLFQGQEMAASSPFLYFADHNGKLANLVRKGRGEFMSQFPSLSMPEVRRALARPNDPSTFERSKLDWSELHKNAPMVALHRDLIRLRRTDEAFRRQAPGGIDGAVLGPELFVIRFRGRRDAEDRLLVVNFGAEIEAGGFPEPLIAPPERCGWKVSWSSEDLRYGGSGTPPVVTARGWRIPGHAAIVLAADGNHEDPAKNRA